MGRSRYALHVHMIDRASACMRTARRQHCRTSQLAPGYTRLPALFAPLLYSPFYLRDPPPFPTHLSSGATLFSALHSSRRYTPLGGRYTLLGATLFSALHSSRPALHSSRRYTHAVVRFTHPGATLFSALHSSRRSLHSSRRNSSLSFVRPHV